MKNYIRTGVAAALVAGAVFLGGYNQAYAQGPLSTALRTVTELPNHPLSEREKAANRSLANMLDSQAAGWESQEAKKGRDDAKKILANQEEILRRLNSPGNNPGNSQQVRPTQVTPPYEQIVLNMKTGGRNYWNSALEGNEESKKRFVIRPADSSEYVDFDTYQKKLKENDRAREAKGFFGRTFRSRTREEFEAASDKYMIYMANRYSNFSIPERRGYLVSLVVLDMKKPTLYEQIYISEREFNEWENITRENQWGKEQALVLRILGQGRKIGQEITE